MAHATAPPNHQL